MRRGKGFLTWLAGAVALLAGVGMAVLVSGATGAPSNEVTIFGDREEVLTIYGSNADDAITMRGNPGGSLTIIGDSLTESRQDCSESAPDLEGEKVHCDLSLDIETITVPLRKGDDRLSIENELGVRLQGDGGEDRDKLFGFDMPEKLSGGDQDDKIFAGRGDDKLEGGKGTDECKGEQGQDEIKNCE